MIGMYGIAGLMIGLAWAIIGDALDAKTMRNAGILLTLVSFALICVGLWGTYAGT